MKLAFVGDIHVGNHRQQGGPLSVGQNERCRSVLRSVHSAAGRLALQDPDAVIVLGDVCDTVKPLPQQLVAFREAWADVKCPIHLLVGNHDRVSRAPGDHALGPLHGERFRVWEKPRWLVLGEGAGEVLLGLCPFDERPVLEWLEPFLREKPRETGLVHSRSTEGMPTLLTGHFGLYDAAARAATPWLASGNDAVEVSEVAKLCKEYGVHWLFVGNYHSRQAWTAYDVELRQVGALVPTGWDNPGWEYGNVEVWNSAGKHTGHVAPGKVERLAINGPRFVVVHSRVELDNQLLESSRRSCPVYVDWRCSPEEYSEASERARLSTTGAVRIEVHVDREHVAKRALVAAGAARSHTTLGEAAEAFVGAMALDANVDRGRVLGHTRRFLGL